MAEQYGFPQVYGEKNSDFLSEQHDPIWVFVTNLQKTSLVSKP